MFDFIDKIGEATIERLFLSLIEGFSAEDLDKAVEDSLSLLDECVKYRPHALALGERLAKGFQGQKKHLTYPNVMEWLSNRRPDFYLHIRFNPKAQEWMKQQVKEISEFLFEY